MSGLSLRARRRFVALVDASEREDYDNTRVEVHEEVWVGELVG